MRSFSFNQLNSTLISPFYHPLMVIYSFSNFFNVLLIYLFIHSSWFHFFFSPGNYSVSMCIQGSRVFSFSLLTMICDRILKLLYWVDFVPVISILDPELKRNKNLCYRSCLLNWLFILWRERNKTKMSSKPNSNAFS